MSIKIVERLQKVQVELASIAKELAGGESKGTLAAKKAWRTMKAQEAEMAPAELKALRRKRSQAAHKAWKTIRAKAA